MLTPMKSRLQARATSVPLYALGAIFLVPLGIGVLLVNNSASRNDHANQVSRDVASMYAQGVDFSNTANQNIALNVADGLGMNIRGGKGVLILSKIRVVHEPDCLPLGAANCVNRGYAVVTQRFVIGNKTAGEPHHLDVAPGLTLKPTARLDPIEIAVDVKLQQNRWMVRRPSSYLRDRLR